MVKYQEVADDLEDLKRDFLKDEEDLYYLFLKGIEMESEKISGEFKLVNHSNYFIKETNKILFGGANVRESLEKLMKENRIFEGFNSMGWTHVIYKFENGKEASVVRYGDCWEMFASKGVDGLFNDIYRGNDEEINEMLEKIKNLI